MANYSNPASKLERAVRALLILRGKATWENSFISNESRSRTLPNRTFVVTSFNPVRRDRPEGTCQMEIWHNFSAIDQPGQAVTQPSVDLDAFIGDTLDSLNIGAASGSTDMAELADAITLAGRWLATPDPNDTTGASALIVAANQDMVNFRCDHVGFGIPMITRGKDTATTNWSEIVHLSAFVSNSNTALPN